MVAAVAISLSGCFTASTEFQAWDPYLNALLLPGFSTILIEVDYMPGYAPDPAALDELTQALENVTQKQIVIPKPTEVYLSVPHGGWDGVSYAAAHAATATYGGLDGLSGDEPVIHALYLAGNSQARDHGGMSFGPYFVILAEMLRGPLPSNLRSVVEAHILVHEAGHSLGLVDMGVPMVTPRATPDGMHSTEKDSPMRQDVESLKEWEDQLVGTHQMPTRFNAHDMEDFRAYQAAGMDTSG